MPAACAWQCSRIGVDRALADRKGPPRDKGGVERRRLALLRHRRLHAAGHFFFGDIFDVGRHPPQVAAEVFHAAVAVAIKLRLGLLDRGAAGGDRLAIRGVAISDVEIQLARHRRPFAMGPAEHDVRVADDQIGVADAAVLRELGVNVNLAPVADIRLPDGGFVRPLPSRE